MPTKSKFSTDDSVKIVKWYYELKDIHKVRWRYAKEKGIEKFPRQLPSKKSFKCVIDRFEKSGSVKDVYPKKMEKKPVTDNEENIEKVRRLVENNRGMSLNQMSRCFFSTDRMRGTGPPRVTTLTSRRPAVSRAGRR